MNKDLDLTEILKDCPKGTEFYSRCIGVVKFDSIDDTLKRIIVKNQREVVSYKENGVYYYADEDAEIDLFPSKDQRDWSKWHRPFKDGDILTTELGSIFILKEPNKNDFYYSCYIALHDKLRIAGSFTQFCAKKGCHLATEEEKQLLFAAIKANGYKWNFETKTLEKLIVPMFKVGDIIQDKDTYKVKITEVNIEDELYGYESLIANGIGGFSFNEQDNWELVPNKFDITVLKPFDNCKYSLDKGRTWKFAQYWYIQDNYFVTDIEIELWQD